MQLISELNSYDGCFEHYNYYENDDYFFETFYSGNAIEAVRAAYYGNDDDGESWEDEVAEMNRDFWKECGAAASNCESWPGWG